MTTPILLTSAFCILTPDFLVTSHQLQRGRGAPLPLADELLQLRAELLDRVLDRPARPVGQAADRRARHDADRLRHLVQDLQVLQPSLAAAHPVEDLHHPSRPLPARRALTARL